MKRPLIEDRDTIRKKVYNYVREQILAGAIAPDERLVETRIALELGTSRTPVREALHNLEIEKLVRARPRVGYVVERMSVEDLEDICDLREAVEVLAIRRALGRAGKKLVKDLSGNLARQEKEVSRGNFTQYIELDTQFHETIAFLSGSGRILDLVKTLRQHMLRYSVQATHFTDTALRSMEGHRHILQAVEKDDADAVTRAIREHLKTAREDIIKYVVAGKQEEREK